MAALDVRVHVVGNRCLDSFWRDASFESSTGSISGTGGTKLVQNVLIDMVVVPVHHRNNLVEVSENGVGTLNHDLWGGKTPPGTRRNLLGDVFAGSVE